MFLNCNLFSLNREPTHATLFNIVIKEVQSTKTKPQSVRSHMSIA
jgi:hypothetical protein